MKFPNCHHINEGMELFICDQCPHVYISKMSLTSHIFNVHTAYNKKEKKCEHCDKVFIGHNSYVEHVMVKHEKKTPFECDECHRSYGTFHRLNSHKQLMHQRVKCDECGKEICNSFILKRHKQSVHGINPVNCYQCEKCPKFFNAQYNLEKHVASKHNDA